MGHTVFTDANNGEYLARPTGAAVRTLCDRCARS
jgi:hypothetical protein